MLAATGRAARANGLPIKVLTRPRCVGWLPGQGSVWVFQGRIFGHRRGDCYDFTAVTVNIGGNIPDPCEWPAIIVEVQPSAKDAADGWLSHFQVRLMHLHSPTLRAPAELRWDPGAGCQYGLTADGLAPSTGDSIKAASALQLLEGEWTLRGRPEKGADWNADRIREWYTEASEAYAEDGSAPRLLDLAHAIGVSKNTAKTVLRREHLPWPPT